jgi:mannose-6-phosphate isomerase-like protein (cupin superfamily)
MSLDVTGHQARVVTTGVDATGRSRVVSDELGPVRFPAPVATSTIVWETTSVPVILGKDVGPSQDWYLPKVGGLRVFHIAFAPDASIDAEARHEHLNATSLEQTSQDRPLGFHTTPTVDVLTVISGELYCLLDDAEVLLRQGDTLVQRGTAHSWSNRTDQIVLAVATMVSAEDASGREV